MNRPTLAVVLRPPLGIVQCGNAAPDGSQRRRDDCDPTTRSHIGRRSALLSVTIATRAMRGSLKREESAPLSAFPRIW